MESRLKPLGNHMLMCIDWLRPRALETAAIFSVVASQACNVAGGRRALQSPGISYGALGTTSIKIVASPALGLIRLTCLFTWQAGWLAPAVGHAQCPDARHSGHIKGAKGQQAVYLARQCHTQEGLRTRQTNGTNVTASVSLPLAHYSRRRI